MHRRWVSDKWTKPKKLFALGAAVFVVIFALVLENVQGNENNHSRVVTAADFVGKWPFTVAKGRVACVKKMAYTFETNGQLYGLNGFADSWLNTRDLHEIWAKDPNHQGLYISIGDMQDAAEAEC